MSDAVYLFSLDREQLFYVIKNLFLDFKQYEERNRANEILKPATCYLKSYLGMSEIAGYHPEEELALDVDMEVFTFINRVEKKAQEKLRAKLTGNYLGFVVSREKTEGFGELRLTDVRNYGDVTVYYKVIKA